MLRKRSIAKLRAKAENRPPGYFEDVRAHAVEWNEAEGWYQLVDEHLVSLRAKWTPHPDPFTLEVNGARRAEADKPILSQPGPGDLLKTIFAGAGIEPKSGCKCKAHARQMNQWWRDECGDVPMDAGKLAGYFKRHGAEIAKWLIAEAWRSKIVIGPLRAWRGIAAGIKALNNPALVLSVEHEARRR